MFKKNASLFNYWSVALNNGNNLSSYLSLQPSGASALWLLDGFPGPHLCFSLDWVLCVGVSGSAWAPPGVTCSGVAWCLPQVQRGNSVTPHICCWTIIWWNLIYTVSLIHTRIFGCGCHYRQLVLEHRCFTYVTGFLAVFFILSASVEADFLDVFLFSSSLLFLLSSFPFIFISYIVEHNSKSHNLPLVKMKLYIQYIIEHCTEKGWLWLFCLCHYKINIYF